MGAASSMLFMELHGDSGASGQAQEETASELKAKNPNAKDENEDNAEVGKDEGDSTALSKMFDSSPHQGWAAKIRPTLDPAIDEAAKKERELKKKEEKKL